MRVLLVDDDERLAALERPGLGGSGHVVDCARSGAEGLRFAEERAYDAIVLDVMMIEDALWTVDKANASNVVDVYIRRLRAKLEAQGEVRLLHTLRGSGYRLEAPRP